MAIDTGIEIGADLHEVGTISPGGKFKKIDKSNVHVAQLPGANNNLYRVIEGPVTPEGYLQGDATILADELARDKAMEAKAVLDKDAGLSEPAVEADSPVVDPSKVGDDGRFAVMAAYWTRNNLHNIEGLALAKELNALIKKHGIEQDEEKIAKLLSGYEKARIFGLQVVPEQQALNDPHLLANRAEPFNLLAGLFVRDKDGSYRPAGGGLAVLEDKGDSMVVKRGGEDGYKAAIELAIAKGWQSIELKGGKKMMAGAWLEAKMKNLEVVGYEPTKEDQVKFAERLSKEGKTVKDGVVVVEEEMEISPVHEHAVATAMAATVEVDARGIEAERMPVQADEQVVNRDFVDLAGDTKIAQTKYTVVNGPNEMVFDNAKDAAREFAQMDQKELPFVFRSTTRVDGKKVADEIVAETDSVAGSVIKGKSVNSIVDHEFSEAFEEFIEQEKGQALLKGSELAVVGREYSGSVVAVVGDKVLQNVGGGKIVSHDVSKLSKWVEIGQMMDVRYDKDGVGKVNKQEMGREQAGGRDLG